MLYKKYTGLLVIMVMLSLSCQVTTKIISTPTLDLSPYQTQTAQSKHLTQENSTVTAQQSLSIQDTQSILSTEIALSTKESMLKQTSVKLTQEKLDVQKTSTQAANDLLAATEIHMSKQTAQADSLHNLILSLVEERAITSASGYYKEVDDFDENWAQLGWYRYWSTGYSQENFVIVSEIEWESASMSADFTRSGCGFVFGEVDDKNYNLTYLALDGYVHLAHIHQGDWRWLASKRYGRLSLPKGEAKIMLVVENQRFSVFVNGEKVATAYDRNYTAGGINYTLLSGTNKDFGTTCKMKNTRLWVIK